MRLNQLLPFRSKTDRRTVRSISLDVGFYATFLSVDVDHKYNWPDRYVIDFPAFLVCVLMEKPA